MEKHTMFRWLWERERSLRKVLDFTMSGTPQAVIWLAWMR